MTTRIGEVWFTHEDNRTSLGQSLGELLRSNPEILGTAADAKHPGVCPLLVKLLFTTEKLSVQVHPDDAYAALHHNCLGKTEAWYVMDSQAPGEVAVGFRSTLTPEQLRESALSGEIEALLDWRRVSKGDVVFTPAGTVHAIGAGVVICEIQENSDITYRLYDYGRPRELHLDHGTTVSDLGPHTYQSEIKTLSAGHVELLACDYFHIEKLNPTASIQILGVPYYQLLICLDGAGLLDGEAAKAGEAFLVPANAPECTLNAPGSEWILTYTP
jgi:mannose-6-phosphate isomerase